MRKSEFPCSFLGPESFHGHEMKYVLHFKDFSLFFLLDCRYILMAEPDHIFVRPLPNLAHERFPAAFPFFYIKPEQNEKILRKFYPEEHGPVTNIDPIGNSPVIIRKVRVLVVALLVRLGSEQIHA